SFSPSIAALDSRMDGDLARLKESGDLTGKALEIVALPSPRGITARRLCLTGFGKTAKAGRAELHDAAAAALRSITGKRYERIALALPDPSPPPPLSETLLACGVGAVQGSVGPGIRKTDPGRFLPGTIVLACPPGTDVRSLEPALGRANAEARAL